MQIVTDFPKLKELSLDGNPCAAKQEFNYELILRIPKLRLLNDDAVKEMDRDVAKDFLEMQGVTLKDLKPAIVKQPKEERPQTASKKVSFAESPVKGKMSAADASDYKDSLT